MRSQRTLLVLVVGLVGACAATAQTSGTLRWRSGVDPLGLQPAIDMRLPCAALSLGCDPLAAVPVYTSETSPRSVTMEVASARERGAKSSASEGMTLNVVGKMGVGQDVGVYGRVGTTVNRSSPRMSSVAMAEGTLSYGVGVSWQFSRSASAVLGWDAYDVRAGTAEPREVRATSLGLRWRY